MSTRFLALSIFAAACAADSGPLGPVDPGDLEPEPLRISGSNCAGAAPVMSADDGIAHPTQSVLAHYYAVMDLYEIDIDGESILQTDIPVSLRDDVAYRTWQAKSIELLAEQGAVGYSTRYYDGNYGLMPAESAATVFGMTPPQPDGTAPPPTVACRRIDRLDYVIRALLAHTGLLQANQCGVNDDGEPKFWEIRPIHLVWIGELYDVDNLIAARIAARPGEVAPELLGGCLVPAWAGGGYTALTLDGGVPQPCKVAYRKDAITEAVVFPLQTAEEVAGRPIERRAFSARGTEPLPSGLDVVREVLRSDQFAAAVLVGEPSFVYDSSYVDEFGRWHHLVRLTGHAVGPRQVANSVLWPDERMQLEGMVGRWQESCCHEICDAPDPSSCMVACCNEYGCDAACFDACMTPQCRTDCALEGVCVTGQLMSGLEVILTSDTIAECAGSCPHPAIDVPAMRPACGR